MNEDEEVKIAMNRKQLLSLMLALAMLLALCACGSGAPAAGGGSTPAAANSDAASADVSSLSISLTKAGEIENSKMENVSFYSAGMVREEEDGTVRLVDPEGNPGSEAYLAVEEVSDSLPDYFVVIKDADAYPNMSGLASVKDGELIPCEFSLAKKLNDRYLEIIYATKQVTDEKDTFIYFTSDMITFRPDSDDEMFAGYAKVFDLERGAFVPDLQWDDNQIEVYTLGENICLCTMHSVTVYSPDGKVLSEIDEGSFFQFDESVECFYESDSESTRLYDDTGKLVDTLDFKVSKCYGADVFAKLTDDSYEMVDASGKKLTDRALKHTPTKVGDLFYSRLSDDTFVVMDSQFNDLLSGAESAYEAELGFIKAEMADGTYALVAPNGAVIRGFASSPYMLSDVQSGTEADLAFLYEDGDYTFKLEEGRAGAIPMAFVSRIDRLNGLYSAVDGTQLLSEKYKEMYYVNNMLYAQSDAGWEVYEVTFAY